MTNSNDVLASVLSDVEKAKIAAFLADTAMVEAVRKVFLAGIYYNGTLVPDKAADPTINFALQWAFKIELQNADVSDASLGADLRAEVKAIRKIEQAFAQLKEYVPAADAPAGKRPNRAK